jgi:hypothetical protein
VLALVLVVAADVHTASRLAFGGAAVEWFDGPRPSTAAVEELHQLPLLPIGAPPGLQHTANVTVAENVGPLIRWYLRDRGAVTYVPNLTPGPALMLGVRASESRPDLRGYDVRDFPLEASWRPDKLTPGQLLRWYLLRETQGNAPAERRAVVYRLV